MKKNFGKCKNEKKEEKEEEKVEEIGLEETEEEEVGKEDKSKKKEKEDEESDEEEEEDSNLNLSCDYIDELSDESEYLGDDAIIWEENKRGIKRRKSKIFLSILFIFKFIFVYTL